MTAEPSPGIVLGELFSTKCLASLVICVRERMCMDEIRALDGDEQLVFIKSELICGGFFASLDDYDGALNVLKTRGAEGGLPREQSVCAVQKSGLGRGW